jgi:PIN domain nuclease of toxin-antitoxin system
MRVLLGTHIFLWSELEPHKISVDAANSLNQASWRYLSIASLWEIQIKWSLGKLPLVTSVADIVERSCKQNSIEILPINQDHIYALADLPPIHRDPFDRMLIAQAQHEHLTLVTADENIPKYAVQTAW